MRVAAKCILDDERCGEMNPDDAIPGKVDPADLDPPATDSVSLERKIFSPRELAALERRDRMSGWLLLVLGGAALVAAIFLYSAFSEEIALNDRFVRIDQEDSESQSDAPFIWGQRRPDAAAPEPSIEEPEQRTTRRPRTSAEEEIPVEEPVEMEFNFPPPPELPAIPTFAGPPAGTVDRETARALRTGRTQRWNERGERGYVLVSKAVAYGSRECRQISYTRFQEDGQASSPSTQWCRIGTDGKWRKDARGPE